jgi:hypothetical protein
MSPAVKRRLLRATGVHRRVRKCAAHMFHVFWAKEPPEVWVLAFQYSFIIHRHRLPGQYLCQVRPMHPRDQQKWFSAAPLCHYWSLTESAPARRLIPEAAPPGSILSSRALNNGKDCSKTFCMVSVAPGSATFTDLTLDKAGTTFKLRFYTQVVYPYTQTTHVWTYDSPPFNVTPPAPRVDRAFFTPDMAQVSP